MKYLYFLWMVMLISLSATAQNNKADNEKLINYYQSQHYADALTYLKSIYHEPVTEVNALSQLAYSSLMAGNLYEADIYYQHIYNQDSANRAALYNLASISLRRGNTLKAKKYYQQIAARDTTNFLVFKQLAKLSVQQNDMAGYIAYLQKANKLNPAEAETASDLSDVYVNLKLLPKAENVLNAAFTIDSSDVILLQSLVKITSAQQKWRETLRVCNQLVQLGDRSGKTLVKLGKAYYHLRDYACGAETLVSMDDNLQTETSLYFTAMCYKRLLDKPSAITYFNKCIAESISPNTDTYYGELAGVYQSNKQYHKALAAYQRGLTFDARPLLYFSLAGLYDELKNKRSAVKYYKRYLATHPPKNELTYFKYAEVRMAQLSR